MMFHALSRRQKRPPALKPRHMDDICALYVRFCKPAPKVRFLSRRLSDRNMCLKLVADPFFSDEMS